MEREEKEDTTIYNVVVNHEEQYSIWPSTKPIPLGWREAGKTGLKDECLAYIKEVWTDMRPLSLRKKMEEWAKNPPPPPPDEPEPEPDDLVQRLSTGSHPVIASLRPDRTVKRLKDAIDRGFVLVKFTGTRGGTELGFSLDKEKSNVRDADFEKGTGKVRLAGNLSLNYVRVRCVADIDLQTLEGEGHLEPLDT